MSAPKPASLTSDLLALKGQAAPAAREEDLYRPETPSPPVVDLRAVAVTQAAEADAGAPATADNVPEASLKAISIARVANDPDEGEAAAPEPTPADTTDPRTDADRSVVDAPAAAAEPVAAPEPGSALPPAGEPAPQAEETAATSAAATPARAPALPPARTGDNRALWAMGLIAAAVAAAVIWITAGGRLPESAPPAAVPATSESAPAPTAPQAPQTSPAPTAAPGPAAADDAPAPVAEPPVPAVEPTQPAQAGVPGQGATATVQGVAPSLDVVRIGGDGFPLLAGRAAPFAELIVLDNGELIGTVTADGNGEWVFYSDRSVATGAHDFTVAVKTPSAAVTLTRPEAAAEPADGAGTGAAADAVVVPVTPQSKPVIEDDGFGDAAADAPADAGAVPVRPQVKPSAQRLPAAAPDLQSSGTVEAPAPYYVVQLGSLPSAADAERLWREIAGRHPNLVADNVLQVQPGRLPGGGSVFRLRTGNFSTRAEARTLCRAFRQAGEDCLVVQRRPPTG